LRAVAQSHPAAALSSPQRRHGPAHQSSPGRGVPRRAVRALGVPRGAWVVAARRRRGAARACAPPAAGRRAGPDPGRAARPGGAGAAGRDIWGGRGTRDEGRVTAARVVRWLWGTSPAARVARLPLVPLAGVYWAAMRVRNARYAGGGVVRLSLPTIAVGNLSV